MALLQTPFQLEINVAITLNVRARLPRARSGTVFEEQRSSGTGQQTPTTDLTCVTRCWKRCLDGLISFSLYSTLPICGSGGSRAATTSSRSSQTSLLAEGLAPGSNRSMNESMSRGGSVDPSERLFFFFFRFFSATSLAGRTDDGGGHLPIESLSTGDDDDDGRVKVLRTTKPRGRLEVAAAARRRIKTNFRISLGRCCVTITLRREISLISRETERFGKSMIAAARVQGQPRGGRTGVSFELPSPAN